MTERANAIEVEGLWTTRGATVIHRDINLQVKTGEVLAIIGGSGSGKSTLLNQMLGLLHPTRGHIRVLGKDMRTLSAEDRKLWASRCGVVFQGGALFSALSVFDNVALPVRETRWWPEALMDELILLTLQDVGIAPADAAKLPAELSGGMVKRVALARALVLEPELLFMDEPTTGLAPDQRHSVDTLIGQVKRDFNLTVIIVTHDVDTLIALADRVAVLADQHIVTVAPLKEVVHYPHPFVTNFFLGQQNRCQPGPVRDYRSRLESACAFLQKE